MKKKKKATPKLLIRLVIGELKYHSLDDYLAG